MSIELVAITGAMGNLGGKLIRYLAARPGYTRLIGLDIHQPSAAERANIEAQVRHGARIDLRACDLTDWHDRRWRDALQAVDAVVHFAARNPFPEATWSDAAASYTMTLNLTQAALDAGVHRFIFASSNHVMGRYKDRGLGPGELTPELEPGVGTVWDTGSGVIDSTAYAVPRVATEWLLDALALQSDGAFTTVCVRIGWCQSGENLPRTLSAAGTPTVQTPDADVATQLAETTHWFQTMWLSNRDFGQLFDRALQADSSNWPQPALIVNGVSNNSGMKWSLDSARRDLGYEPQDDVRDPVHWT